MAEFILMVVPCEPLVELGRRLKLTARDLDELIATATQELELDGEVDMTLVSAESDAEPVPVTSLEEVPRKAKVQFWPKGRYGTNSAGAEPTAPGRTIVMLVGSNEVFAVAQKVVVENAGSVADLIAGACEKLGQAVDPIDYVLNVGGTAVDSLDDVPDKAKVTIALRAQAAQASTAAEEAQGTITFADDVDGSARGSLKKSYAAGEYADLLSPEDLEAESVEPARAREVLLMVTENDAVQHSKKLQIVASGIDELFDKVAEGLGIDEPVFVCPVASSVDEAIPFESLDDVADKVKVSVWPARCFGTEFEDTDADGPESSLEAPRRGISFADGTDGSSAGTLSSLRKSHGA